MFEHQKWLFKNARIVPKNVGQKSKEESLCVKKGERLHPFPGWDGEKFRRSPSTGVEGGAMA